MDLQIDRPADWYKPESSHHAQHAVMGAIVGLPTYVAVYALSDSRWAGLGCATLMGGVVGVAYEIQRGYDGSAYIDPVDMAWTALGGLAGGLAADLTGQAIELLVQPDEVAVAWSIRF